MTFFELFTGVLVALLTHSGIKLLVRLIVNSIAENDKLFTDETKKENEND